MHTGRPLPGAGISLQPRRGPHYGGATLLGRGAAVVVCSR
jgi:hypothetical protein